MKRLAFVLLLVLTAAGSGRAERPEAPVADSTAIAADTTLSFGLVIRNRLYPEWSEEQEVKLFEIFFLGDTEYTARVEGFMPNLKVIDGKPRNASPFLENPAAHVYVYRDTAVVDSSWAFLNFPPHFSPRSFFAFQLKALGGYREPAREEEVH
jgi:hypothetical protein